MLATNINSLGKIEKNAKVKAGKCIFPFKYKYEEHDKCYDTNKGAICATEINQKTKTLVKYGYCQTKSPKTPKSSKTPKTPKSPKSVTPTTSKKGLLSNLSITKWFDDLLYEKRPKKGTQKKALKSSKKDKEKIKLKRRKLKVKSSTLKNSNNKSSNSQTQTPEKDKKKKTIRRRKLVPKTED